MLVKPLSKVSHSTNLVSVKHASGWKFPEINFVADSAQVQILTGQQTITLNAQDSTLPEQTWSTLEITQIDRPNLADIMVFVNGSKIAGNDDDIFCQIINHPPDPLFFFCYKMSGRLDFV